MTYVGHRWMRCASCGHPRGAHVSPWGGVDGGCLTNPCDCTAFKIPEGREQEVQT